jgi:hypothetical protein
MLWWPNKMGLQMLYNVTAKFTVAGPAGVPAANNSASTGSSAANEVNIRTSAKITTNIGNPIATTIPTIAATRRIGFRTVALVTGNDTDPTFVADGGDGSANFTMMLRVNGAERCSMLIKPGFALGDALGYRG